MRLVASPSEVGCGGRVEIGGEGVAVLGRVLV